MIQIIPSPGPQTDFDTIKSSIEKVIDLVSWIHIDILDNTLIKNVTYNNWDSFKTFKNQIKLEAHLMVSDPRKYLQPLHSAGFERIIAHAESDTIRDFIHEAKELSIEVGVAIDGPSDLEIVEPYLGEVSCALVMMYTAGASGQVFQPAQLTKVRKIHEEYSELPIEVDGGIDKTTAPLVIEAGATQLVSTSYLFWKNADRIAEAIEELKG